MNDKIPKHNNLQPLRKIKSFVRRNGHFSLRHKNGFAEHWHEFGLEQSKEFYNFNTVFQREAPLILEIGFGMGESLINLALTNPEHNIVGIEVHRPGVGNVLASLHEHAIKNVRLFNADVVDVLQQNIANDTLHGVQIFFPDPWPKRRHHKRRLIQPFFIELILPKMKQNSFIHVATDWEDYAQAIMRVLSSFPQLVNSAGVQRYSPRPSTRSKTKYEQRGIKLGYQVWDLIFTIQATN